MALTGDTGYFWFFDRNNVEMALKVIDGCSLNSRHWVFAAGLTNVRVDITVTDTSTGAVKTYRNPQGTAFRPLQDTQAFSTCGQRSASHDAPPLVEGVATAGAELGALLQSQAPDEQPSHATAPPLPVPAESAKATCSPTSTALCLNNQRFKVEARWETRQGTAGQGRAVRLTNDTGYFWFFDSNNVEMIIKVLDACSFNDRFWVFAAGLTDVRVEITVTDMANGAVSRYINPQGTAFQPVQEVKAFATCDGTLPVCTEQNVTKEEIQTAVVRALSTVTDPMGDVTDYDLTVRMTEAKVGCSLRRVTAFSAAPEVTGEKACGVSGVNYCGPGTSATNPFLNVVAVSSCLNQACCEHDSCYGSKCVGSECMWTPQSQQCDDAMLSICRGDGACGFFQLLHPGTAMVCAIAECMNGTLTYPLEAAVVCPAVRAARLAAEPGCRRPSSLTNCNVACTGQTCSTFTSCNPGSGCSSPVCGTITEGGGVCVEGETDCGPLAGCNSSADCPGGLCLGATCCGRNVCVNVSHFCPDIGAPRSQSLRAITGQPTIGRPF